MKELGVVLFEATPRQTSYVLCVGATVLVLRSKCTVHTVRSESGCYIIELTVHVSLSL
jgi:hypothetical protein